MKNKNWIRKISNTYIQLNEEEEIQLQQKPTPMKVGEKVGELTFASIFDENLWGELVQGNSKPDSGLGLQSVEQQRMLRGVRDEQKNPYNTIR